MKKKRIIIASILGATALIAGASAVTIITSSVVKSKEVESIKLEDSTLAEDELFGGELPSLIATKKVQKAQAPSAELVSPVIGRQYAYDDVNKTVSIRFYAAITSLDVDAVWTRALYNADGSVNTALAAGTKKSTVAYETLKYKEGGDSKQLNATDVEAEDGTKPFKYFVLYTLKNVKVSTYGECTIDAYVEISNDAEAVVSKTGSVTTNSTASKSSYTLDLDMDNTYQGSNTSAGNGQYINGKVKTIYSMSDTAIDTSFLDGVIYKDDVAQAKTYSTTTISFKGDVSNAANNYIVYEDQAISPSLTLGMFTLLDNGQGVVADNGDWLKFNTGGKVKFTLNTSAKLAISFYQDKNNVKVTVDGDEVSIGSDGQYSLNAGDVEIEAVSNGYLGKIIVNKVELFNAYGFNPGVAGEQTISVKYKNASSTYNIYVVDTAAYQDADENYVVTVDPTYSGQIGGVSGTKGNMFNTISQALEFLQNTSFVPKMGYKILNISAGYYHEKLEITTPNLTINGSGTLAKGTYASDENYDSDDVAAATIIEYDTLYGDTDSNGFSHITDSTQTVAVRETATNCKINGVTISNAWNCKSYFDAKGVSNEHRALALLVQADKFSMNNSALLGYQDTVELFTGRQYLKNCYISGVTDFIFGTNNTTYFDTCEIHTIYNGSTDGGYINAFKGSNRGSTDAVKYGAIYDHCNFTADAAVTSSNTSIARGWTEYSKVAVINSTLGAHISTAGYSNNSTKNERYVAWDSNGGNAPTLSTIEYVEYNNDGAGKLTSAVNGMTILDKTTAANYSNFAVIFGKTNGNVSYSLSWHPINGLEQDNNVYHIFHGSAPTTGTSYVYDGTESFTTFTENGITYTNCWRRTGGNDDLAVNGSISFDVEAGTTVTINSYPGYHYYKIGDACADLDTVSYYFATAQTVTLNHTGSTFYLYSIVINKTLAAPETAVMNSISISGQPTADIQVGDDCDLSNLKVKAHYSDGTYRNITTFTTDADTAIDKTKAGKYTVTVSYNDGTTTKTATFDVNYVATVDNTISEPVGFDFNGTAFSGCYVGNNIKNVNNDTYSAALASGVIEKVTFNTDGSNGTTNWLKFNENNTISFETSAPCLFNICYYNGTNNATLKLDGNTITPYSNNGSGHFKVYSYELKSAGTIVLEASSNGYIGFFELVFNVSFDEESTVIDKDTQLILGSNNSTLNTAIGAGLQAETSSTKLDYNGFTFDASTGKIAINGGDNIQFNTGAKITFTVAANATVTVKGYPGNYAYSLNGTVATAADTSITVDKETEITVLATGDKYLKEIDISYPATVKVISTTTRIAFGGSDVENYSSLISQGLLSSTCTIAVNGDAKSSDNSMIYGGKLEFYVNSGATVTIYGNYKVEYVANGTAVSGMTGTIGWDHVVEYDSDGKITIECDTDSTGDNYFYWIDVTY